MFMRNALFFLFLFLCSSFLVINKRMPRIQDDNEIIWRSDRKLTWDDFKAHPNQEIIKNSVIIQAQTAASIELFSSSSKNELLTIKVCTKFIKDKSWTVVRNEKLLKHEQLHFDIFELYARKMRKAFDSLNMKKVKDIRQYEDIYDLYNQKCDQYNELYDNQVYFNDARQEQWFKKVATELDNLKKYEDR